MKENLVYHYTNLNALLGIIGLEPNKLVFWGSRYDCMNDPLDYQYARNKILPLMMDVAKDLVKENEIPNDAVEEINVIPYIVCFSKKADDFLMWRMYNAKVALVLDKHYFEKTTSNRVLIDCEYVDEKFSNLRDSFMRIDKKIGGNMNVSMNVSINTSMIATFIKSDAFETEGETRLASWDYFDKSGKQLTIQENRDEDNFVGKELQSRFNAEGKLILFKRFFIEKKALKGLIIHTYSKLEFENIRNSLQSLLRFNKFENDLIENITSTNAYPFNI